MCICDIKDKIKFNSPVILGFTGTAMEVFILGIVTNNLTTRTIFTLRKTSYFDLMQYIRMFTYVLGHGSWQHIVGNFTIILAIGPMIEERYGSKHLLIMIIITAFVTALLNIIFFRNTQILGASGIAFMFILLGSFTNVEKGKIPATFIIIILFFIIPEIVQGIMGYDNVSQFGHIIGGVCGGIFGCLNNRK